MGVMTDVVVLGIAGADAVKSLEQGQLLANGNRLAATGTYTRADGSSGTTGQTADIDLAQDT